MNLFRGVFPAFLFVLASANSNVCVSKTLQYCQLLFNQNLNVTSSNADWTNPDTLSFIVRSYYLQGIDGLLSVCNARQHFSQCLGEQYDSCMTELNFINSGQTPENAAQYVQSFKMMEFDCDGGFIQSSRHWSCIALVLQTKNDGINNCRQKYQDGIKAKPTEICSISADYESCVRQYFGDSCGPEPSWWSCERTRRSLSLDKICPDSTCNFSGSVVGLGINSGSEENVDGVEKVFNHISDHAKVLRSLADNQQQK